MEEQTRELFARSVKILKGSGGVAGLNALDVPLSDPDTQFGGVCLLTMLAQADPEHLPLCRPL